MDIIGLPVCDHEHVAVGLRNRRIRDNSEWCDISNPNMLNDFTQCVAVPCPRRLPIVGLCPLDVPLIRMFAISTRASARNVLICS